MDKHCKKLLKEMEAERDRAVAGREAWYEVAMKHLAEIERLRAALVALLASYEKNYDRGEEGRYSPWEEQVFRDATALVNEQISVKGGGMRPELEVPILKAENAVLRAVLRDAKEKLEAYYTECGGKYPGGPNYRDLMANINDALAR